MMKSFLGEKRVYEKCPSTISFYDKDFKSQLKRFNIQVTFIRQMYSYINQTM
jgi:hypothetical protein